MWLSEQMKNGREAVRSAAQIGQVSLGGASVAVVTAGEHRELSVALPGGFRWRPELGQKVLVLTSDEGESVVVGVVEQSGALSQGELKIQGEKCSISLKNGRIAIEGELVINGEEYKPCTCSGVI